MSDLLSDSAADRTVAGFAQAPGGQAPAAGVWVPQEEMVALQNAVDVLRRSRLDAHHRASRLENELAALRLNERILQEELRAGLARTADQDRLRAEHSRLQADHTRLLDEHTRLLDEHVRLRDDNATTLSRLEIETRRLRDVEAARAAADSLAADASRDLGEAVSDLLEARGRCAALEAQLSSLRADHEKLLEAHETLTEQKSAAEETAERNLLDQRRAHDALRADAAAAHEHQLRTAAAAHERAMVAAAERVEGAEARVSEMTEKLHAMTQSRDQALADLEKSESAVEVMRQRLRDEIDAHTDAEERRSLLEDELSYLRAEVFSSGQTKAGRRGFLSRRARGSASAARAAMGAATPSASKDATDGVKPPVPELVDDDRESVLERRLFGG